MPIYEYQCSNCMHAFDLLQKMSEEPIKSCPECLEDAAVRLVSAAGFQLKGSGWYETDFKNKDKPAKKTDKPASVSEAQTTETAVSKKASEPKVSSTTAKGESD